MNRRVSVNQVSLADPAGFPARTWELPEGVIEDADSIPAISWLYDTSDQSIIWSYPIEEFFGFAPGVRGFIMTQVGGDQLPAPKLQFSATIGEMVMAPVLETLACTGALPVQESKLLVDCPDGTTRNLVHRCWPVTVPDTKGAYGKAFANLYTGVLLDTSAQQRFESELGGLIDRYRLLTEVSPDAILVHQEGLVVYGNQAALRLAGLSCSEEGYGHSILEFVHPEDIPAMVDRIGMLTEEGQYFEHGEARIVSVDGTSTYCEATSVRTTWASQPAYQVILRDISERRAAEAAARYRASLITHVSDAIVGVGTAGQIESWNQAAQGIYSWTEEEVLGRQFGEVVGDSALAALDFNQRGKLTHHRKDGSPVAVTITADTLRDGSDTDIGWVVVCTELTDARLEKANRRAAEERYEAVVASLSEGIVLFDSLGRITTTNDAAAVILGDRLTRYRDYHIFNADLLTTTATGQVITPELFPHVKTLATGEPQSGVVIGVSTTAGQRQWLSVSTRLLAGSAPGADTLVVCSFTDVTDRKEAEAQLEWLAYHDALTGLGNRTRFEEDLESELVHNRRHVSDLAVFFIDLDHFKLVNDSFGHHAGDEVLVILAQRFKQIVRTTDLVSRFSGDEFVILCKNIPSLAIAQRLAEEYMELVAEPIELSSDRSVTMSCSLGISYVHGGEYQVDDILQQADAAMFQAKKIGRSHVEIFDDALRAKTVAKLEVYDDLRHSISRDELVVFYQPIASVTDSHVVGLEALVRWNHPTRGLLGPMEFIPLAEETDLIFTLGRWVLREACFTMARWRNEVPGARDTYITVNLSTHQLHDPELVDSIAQALADSGLPPEGLIMEVTESALMSDTVDSKQILRSINDMGVGLAIDDFGTGHSSLAQLKRFPVRILKIDKAFIDGVATFEMDAAIVNTIVQLGQTFNLRVVAEGVETANQLARIAELGCGYYQGYYLSRPTPSDAVSFTAPEH